MRRGIDFRAQVGIGTLIVFIAMILVAAIAAGVLINTAGFLQSKSETTGQQSSDQVSNRLMVVSATGEVGPSGVRLVPEENPSTLTINGSDLTADGGPDYADHFEKEYQINDGQTVYLYIDNSGVSGKLVVEGKKSPLYTNGNDIPIRFKSVSDGKIQVKDTKNDVIINTVSPPVEMWADIGDDSDLYLKEDQFMDVGNPDGSNEVVIRDPDQDESYVGWTIEKPTGNATVPKTTESINNVIRNASVTVRRNSGSDPVNLRNLTVHYISDRTAAQLVYSEDKALSENFSVTYLSDPGPVLDDNERAILNFNISAIEGEETRGLSPSSKVDLLLITKQGAKMTVTLTVPDSLSGEAAVQL